MLLLRAMDERKPVFCLDGLSVQYATAHLARCNCRLYFHAELGAINILLPALGSKSMAEEINTLKVFPLFKLLA